MNCCYSTGNNKYKKSYKKPTKKRVYKPKKSYSNGRYAIQIASFSNIDGAISTQERYDKMGGYKTIIKDTQTDYGRVFKVLLIGFTSEAEAREFKNKSAFRGAFIVKDN